MTRKIHWRCFHCGDTFTLAQRKHAEAHFGAEESALPVCQMRVPGEYHLLSILRKMEGELRAFYAEDTELWRALYAQSADHAQALRSEEERGYAKGLADGRAFSAENSPGDGMGGVPSPRKAAREDPMSFREVETGET